jgi:hypothetical protein
MVEPWFRYRSEKGRLSWWPCHWKRWAVGIAGIISAFASIIVVPLLLGPHPKFILVSAVIFSLPFLWLAHRHSERMK